MLTLYLISALAMSPALPSGMQTPSHASPETRAPLGPSWRFRKCLTDNAKMPALNRPDFCLEVIERALALQK
jgi:hypothetical protein